MDRLDPFEQRRPQRRREMVPLPDLLEIPAPALLPGPHSRLPSSRFDPFLMLWILRSRISAVFSIP